MWVVSFVLGVVSVCVGVCVCVCVCVCVLSKEGSYIENEKTKEKIMLKVEKGELSCWTWSARLRRASMRFSAGEDELSKESRMGRSEQVL